MEGRRNTEEGGDCSCFSSAVKQKKRECFCFHFFLLPFFTTLLFFLFLFRTTAPFFSSLPPAADSPHPQNKKTMSEQQQQASRTPTVESEPAKAAGMRETRHPGDEPAGDESRQRFAEAQDLSGVEAPEGAGRDLRDTVEEAKAAQTKPYEPHSTSKKD